MPGTLACVVALAALPFASRAQPAETIIRLTVDPMPAPKPALRYQLLPELKEMSSGNPIPNYIKVFLDPNAITDSDTLRPAALRQADRAARMDRPDWQILPKLRTDGINLLIPDVQKMRALAGGLQERFREEVAARRFDDALGTAKTMFAMSRHMNEHPTLIGGLVGIAIAQITIAPLEAMLEQPGCPNLYWALTNLPAPLVSLDRGFEGERVFLLAELKDLDDTAPMTPEQIRKVIKRIDYMRQFDGGPRQPATQVLVDQRIRDKKHFAAARRRLIEYGIPEDRLSRFPPGQVILLDERLQNEIVRDEDMKLMALPMWEIIKRRDPNPPKNTLLLGVFNAAIFKVRQAQARLEQRVALLRHVEAIRLYAAAHRGQLPLKLTDIDVPLPVDPITGKPFRYEVVGATAHLRGTPPPGSEKIPAFNIHYAITIRK